MVKEIADLQLTPVIAPSIWEYADMAKARKFGASAISICARFHNPEMPAHLVQRDAQRHR
jgi:hypothetical protein